MGPTYLAIDLTSSRLTAGVIADDGTVIVRDRVANQSRQMWPLLIRLARRVLAASPLEQRPVAGGVAVTGEVSLPAGALQTRHEPGWIGFDLRAELEAALGIPIAVDSRGRASALGEHRWGVTRDHRTSLVIVADETVDGGVIERRRLLDGSMFQAGQIGHVVVDPNGLRCRCGGTGCLEAYVGALSIQTDTSRLLARTPAPIIERSGMMLGRGIASLAAVVDPSIVVVYGSVIAAFGAPMMESMQRELAVRLKLSHTGDLRVLSLGSGGTAPLLGAAALASALVSNLG